MPQYSEYRDQLNTKTVTGQMAYILEAMLSEVSKSDAFPVKHNILAGPKPYSWTTEGPSLIVNNAASQLLQAISNTALIADSYHAAVT
jgi:hypothetical protein